LNLIDTEKTSRSFYQIKNRTQIRTEFVKDPHYRIYFTCEDQKIYRDLKEKLDNHQSVYTLSLGLAYLLANFEFVGEFDYMVKTNENVLIDSVVLRSELKEGALPSFDNDVEIFKTKTPIVMTPERIVTKYEDIFYERSAGKMYCEIKEYQKIENGENVVFLT